jgi:ACS family tartrate transporter-like MFS transporter
MKCESIGIDSADVVTMETTSWGGVSELRRSCRAAGLVGAGVFGNSFLALAVMSAATVGLFGSKPVFWPMPSSFLTGTAAGRIALVNAIGNLGGYAGPFVVGWIKYATGSFEAGLYFLAASALASAIIAYFDVQPAARLNAQRGRATPAA